MWPPESGLLSLGRQGVANDDGRHLPALPIFAGVLFNWNVLSSCLSCLGNSRMAHGRFLPRQRDPILVWQQTIVAQPLCLCKTCFRFPHPPSKIVELRQGLHHLLNALKQSLRRTPTTTTHRQAPRKTIINLGRRAMRDALWLLVSTPQKHCSPKGETAVHGYARSERSAGVQ